MSKYQPFIKLFTVLFMSTSFIFSFSHFGSLAFGKIGNNDGMFSEGTAVGSVNLSGKTENEAISLLEERHIDWVKNAKIELQYSEKTAAFDMNLFYFDATETVLNLKDGQKNTASISIDLLQAEEQINLLFPEVDSKELELTKLTENLTNTASHFENGTFSFYLNKDYLLVKGKQSVISEVIVELEAVSAELSNVINSNPQITINEESTFSFLEFAKQQKIENSSALNIVATGIYQAVLPTNLTISERNISKALPKYAVLGFEAMVNVAKGTDLVIDNPNKVPYTLQLELANGDLKVTLKGDRLLYKYEVRKKDEQILKPKTIVQYSPLVLPGKTKVEAEGSDGKIVKVYRNIYQGSQLLTSELISEDYYPPVYRVEIMGLAGTQQGTSTTRGAISNGTTNSNGTQTPSASDTDKLDSKNDDLWGKKNEEEK
ncbi:VanW family protein [Neobacillus drentensis]|uniref:VanW family protein n=1 Tax=Neobacillus drentensis TaxID=220684 RepID=UPI002FFF21E7